MELRWQWKSSTRSETGCGGEGSGGSGLYIFHYKVGYHYRNWGSHGCAMDLLVKGIAKGKVCGIQAELDEGCDFVCC